LKKHPSPDTNGIRFGIEFAPEVVQADGNVRNLAWRICNAKKILVGFLRTHAIDITNISRPHTACLQAVAETRPRYTSAALAVPLFLRQRDCRSSDQEGFWKGPRGMEQDSCKPHAVELVALSRPHILRVELCVSRFFMSLGVDRGTLTYMHNLFWCIYVSVSRWEKTCICIWAVVCRMLCGRCNQKFCYKACIN
jgi:hypothetical protein